MWGGERAHRRLPYTFNRPTASSNVGRLSSPTCPSQHVGRCWMTVSVTYREIAERFGIGVEGARLKAKRRAAKGLWRIVPGNHPQDVVRVEVPEDEWTTRNEPRPTAPYEGTPTTPPPQEEHEALCPAPHRGSHGRGRSGVCAPRLQRNGSTACHKRSRLREPARRSGTPHQDHR